MFRHDTRHKRHNPASSWKCCRTPTGLRSLQTVSSILVYVMIVSIFSYLFTIRSAEKLSLSLNSLGLTSRRFIDMFRRVHGIIPVSIQTYLKYDWFKFVDPPDKCHSEFVSHTDSEREKYELRNIRDKTDLITNNYTSVAVRCECRRKVNERHSRYRKIFGIVYFCKWKLILFWHSLKNCQSMNFCLKNIVTYKAWFNLNNWFNLIS